MNESYSSPKELTSDLIFSLMAFLAKYNIIMLILIMVNFYISCNIQTWKGNVDHFLDSFQDKQTNKPETF